ncbi:putative GOLD domain-containing protein [Helianthus annuus]|nr:putative GOLD domain-containing protein [Helianthus annuus]KAJ0517917.1 putative GOLD domain-containing protein [Helianthus annuus]KAJ0685935.1 putative GOLD domain-containing protein [Helianthus annuus]KAJ0689799.1 putative GOLD domain-containing protein [Helianthus annuus]
MYLQMYYDQFDILYVSGERYLVQEVDSQPPHKIDENMWKNREHIEEIIFLLETSHWPKLLQQQSTTEDIELARLLKQLREKCGRILEIVESFQSKNAENVFNTVMTYMPQDFRGTLIRKQRERSEKNKKAQVDALVSAGGSIRDRYALLWQQQMERRRQLAQLGSAGGVYKTVVKYLVGVPQVLLDFVRQINDDQGPMEEQRHRYGLPMYALTKLVLNIHLFLSLSWWRFQDIKLEVFANSPFFVTVEEAGAIEANKNDDYKEASVPAGTTYEVSLEVDSVNSYVAWDFSIAQGKISMDIGFSIEYTNSSGRKTLILPYRRYDSDQGNFCTISAGNYKLIWDNSFSTFFKKALRYKVDCIPPVVEPDAEERGTL